MQTKIQENSETPKENAKIRFLSFLNYFLCFAHPESTSNRNVPGIQEALLLKKETSKQKPKNSWTLKDALKRDGVFTIPTLKKIQSYKEYPMGALIGIFKRLLVVWRRKGSLSPCLACCQIISLARKPVSVDETKNGCTHAKVPVKVTPLFFVCTHHQLEVSSATPTAPDTWHLKKFLRISANSYSAISYVLFCFFHYLKAL